MAAEMSMPKRIMLIHALQESQVPIWEAFKRGWPEARLFNLMDDSLSADLAAEGKLTQAIIHRFHLLGRYAADAGTQGQGADGILFTCSAFGPAIELVKKDLEIPVLHPNEAAFEEALEAGARIGMLVSFGPSLPALTADFQALADKLDKPLKLEARLVDGALKALQSGNAAEHDRLIADAAKTLPNVDAIVLGQFSMARAKAAIQADVKVLTTPDCAVAKIRRVLGS